MNKKTINLLMVAVLAAVMAMPHEAIAKRKKVQYLGHYYKGEVNKQKLPEGQGEMNIGGLLISGIFNGNSATNAEVCTSNYGNCKFRGTITFDESNNITLKSGGLFITEYYVYKESLHYATDEVFKNVESLTKDHVVNADTFEKKELKMKCSVSTDSEMLWYRYLNGPKELEVPIYPREGRLYDKEKYDMVKGYSERKQEIFVKPVYIDQFSDIKDDQGRIWSCSFPSYSVLFPDGTEITDKEWKSKRSDGIIIRGYNIERIGWDCIGTLEISLGNGFSVLGRRNPSVFMALAKRSPFYLEPGELRSFNVYSDLIKEGTSSVEIEKMLRENVLPFSKNFGKESYDIITVVNRSGSEIGHFRDGKYSSMAEIEKKKLDAAEAEKKADKEAYDKLCKKYGAKYVNAYYKGIPIVGMPEGLLKGLCNKIYSQSGSSKTYYIYPWPTARDNQRVFTVYVYNGKVSRVIDHR